MKIEHRVGLCVMHDRKMERQIPVAVGLEESCPLRVLCLTVPRAFLFTRATSLVSVSKLVFPPNLFERERKREIGNHETTMERNEIRRGRRPGKSCVHRARRRKGFFKSNSELRRKFRCFPSEFTISIMLDISNYFSLSGAEPAKCELLSSLNRLSNSSLYKFVLWF